LATLQAAVPQVHSSRSRPGCCYCATRSQQQWGRGGGTSRRRKLLISSREASPRRPLPSAAAHPPRAVAGQPLQLLLRAAPALDVQLVRKAGRLGSPAAPGRLGAPAGRQAGSRWTLAGWAHGAVDEREQEKSGRAWPQQLPRFPPSQASPPCTSSPVTGRAAQKPACACHPPGPLQRRLQQALSVPPQRAQRGADAKLGGAAPRGRLAAHHRASKGSRGMSGAACCCRLSHSPHSSCCRLSHSPHSRLEACDQPPKRPLTPSQPVTQPTTHLVASRTAGCAS
jgi:hypothetical protein